MRRDNSWILLRCRASLSSLAEISSERSFRSFPTEASNASKRGASWLSQTSDIGSGLTSASVPLRGLERPARSRKGRREKKCKLYLTNFFCFFVFLFFCYVI